MGFGLFVPEFRAVFSLDATAVGLISALGFAGFFAALLLAQILLDRRGPALPVLTGLGAATLGIGLVTVAPNALVLCAGVFFAAASAGFAWTPFNDAVHRKIRDVDRPTALSEISTGTSAGIAAAGLAALAMGLTGLSWRLCWAVFLIASAAAFLANWAALRDVEKAPAQPRDPGWRDLWQAAMGPPVAVAFAFGTTSAIYISFAADHLTGAGGVTGLPTAATPALVFICFGVAGLAGLLTGRFRAAIGLPLLLRLTMLAGALSLALLGVLPGGWPALAGSAGLQGVHVMVTSAILAFWTERLFPDMPTRAFTAALLACAAGNILGPALGGLVHDALGPRAMFLGAAVVPAALLIGLGERHIREEPAGTAPADPFPS